MGGAILSWEAPTETEAKRLLKEKRRECRIFGMHEERFVVRYDKKDDVWKAILAVHS